MLARRSFRLRFYSFFLEGPTLELLGSAQSKAYVVGASLETCAIVLTGSAACLDKSFPIWIKNKLKLVLEAKNAETFCFYEWCSFSAPFWLTFGPFWFVCLLAFACLEPPGRPFQHHFHNLGLFVGAIFVEFARVLFCEICRMVNLLSALPPPCLDHGWTSMLPCGFRFGFCLSLWFDFQVA